MSELKLNELLVASFLENTDVQASLNDIQRLADSETSLLKIWRRAKSDANMHERMCRVVEILITAKARNPRTLVRVKGALVTTEPTDVLNLDEWTTLQDSVVVVRAILSSIRDHRLSKEPNQ